MRVDSINTKSIEAGAVMPNSDNDSLTKNLRVQIANAEKEIQSISQDKQMSAEERKKKQQELQKQIEELNRQLEQRKLELQKEKDEAKERLQEEKAEKANNEREPQGLSQIGAEIIAVADGGMVRIKHQGKVVSEMQAQENVLKSEIEQDTRRGRDVETKKEELTDVRKRVRNTANSQMGLLGTLQGKMIKAQKEELQEDEEKKVKLQQEKLDFETVNRNGKTIIKVKENRLWQC
ncbi:MAG: FlxA-like family protein [Lachnospiraceae bacterium]|nr:FlxA-like family protein [Lachnospiraceae bacterium]